MALDPELKQLLTALAEGQIKLAEGQVKLEVTVAHLASATESALTRLTERLDAFRDEAGPKSGS